MVLLIKTAFRHSAAGRLGTAHASASVGTSGRPRAGRRQVSWTLEIGGRLDMRNLKVFALATVAGLLVAGSLQAQTATGLTAWRGVNGTWGSYNNTGSGSATWNVYTSPYRAAFQIPSLPTNAALLPPAGTSSFGPTRDVFCVDFNHYANTNSTTGYQTFFTNLGDANVGSYLGVYTRDNSLTHYLAAAYL